MLALRKNKRGVWLVLILTGVLLFSAPVWAANSGASGASADEAGEPVYYSQSTDLCYTGCAAWKLYWSRNAFWQYIEDYCMMDAKDAAKTLVKFAFNTVRSSPDFGVFIQSLYCATFIKLYIVPRLFKKD